MPLLDLNGFSGQAEILGRLRPVRLADNKLTLSDLTHVDVLGMLRNGRMAGRRVTVTVDVLDTDDATQLLDAWSAGGVKIVGGAQPAPPRRDSDDTYGADPAARDDVLRINSAATLAGRAQTARENGAAPGVAPSRPFETDEERQARVAKTADVAADLERGSSVEASRPTGRRARAKAETPLPSNGPIGVPTAEPEPQAAKVAHAEAAIAQPPSMPDGPPVALASVPAPAGADPAKSAAAQKAWDALKALEGDDTQVGPQEWAAYHANVDRLVKGGYIPAVEANRLRAIVNALPRIEDPEPSPADPGLVLATALRSAPSSALPPPEAVGKIATEPPASASPPALRLIEPPTEVQGGAVVEASPGDGLPADFTEIDRSICEVVSVRAAVKLALDSGVPDLPGVEAVLARLKPYATHLKLVAPDVFQERLLQAYDIYRK